MEGARHEHADKCARLLEQLGALESVAVAFSGGVDSSVLLHAARRALGERACALIADSPSLARSELAQARGTAQAIGARLVVLATNELGDERYRANRGDRCYWCKRTLFDAMRAWAAEHGWPALAFGEIVDDLGEARPGARAAREAQVLAPLSAAGFDKADVRRYAREHGLAVWDKPSAPCLASRLPTGTEVSAQRLARIERAEAALHALGLCVLRVRDRGARARVEVGADELARARELWVPIAAALAECGFEDAELAPYAPPASAAAAPAG